MLVRLILEVGIVTLLITGFITQIIIPFFKDTAFFPLFHGKSTAQRRIVELERQLREEKAAREVDALQQEVNAEFTKRMLGDSNDLVDRAQQEQPVLNGEALRKEKERKLAERVAFGDRQKQ